MKLWQDLNSLFFIKPFKKAGVIQGWTSVQKLNSVDKKYFEFEQKSIYVAPNITARLFWTHLTVHFTVSEIHMAAYSHLIHMLK